MNSVVFGLQPRKLSHTLQLEEHYNTNAPRIGPRCLCLARGSCLASGDLRMLGYAAAHQADREGAKGKGSQRHPTPSHDAVSCHTWAAAALHLFSSIFPGLCERS